jgi:hypothetical protein
VGASRRPAYVSASARTGRHQLARGAGDPFRAHLAEGLGRRPDLGGGVGAGGADVGVADVLAARAFGPGLPKSTPSQHAGSPGPAPVTRHANSPTFPTRPVASVPALCTGNSNVTFENCWIRIHCCGAPAVLLLLHRARQGGPCAWGWCRLCCYTLSSTVPSTVTPRGPQCREECRVRSNIATQAADHRARSRRPGGGR